MNTIIKKLSITIFCLFATVVLAEQKVNLSDESAAKEILLDKKWECGLGDGSGWGGQSVWNFEEINGNKVKGTVNLEYCSGSSTGTAISRTDAVLTGKKKKDTLKFTVKVNQGNCVTFSGRLKFVREDATSYRADGNYSRSHGGVTYRGTLFCYVR